MGGPATSHPVTRSHGRTCGLLVALRRRQAANAAGLLMFLVGFVAAPCLHNLDHRDDHEHRADGSIHVHVEGTDPVATSAADGRAAVSRDSRHAHGAGSLAHFGVALTAPAYFVFVAPPVPIAELAPPTAKPAPLLSARPQNLRSRGPPAA